MAGNSVLVIEDDDGIRGMLQLILETEGYEVLTAPNGKEGVDVLRKRADTSLVLLDLMMPVMNGWEFLEARKEDGVISKIPVVVLTASGMREKPEGADELYPKPVELDEILRITEKYCGLRRTLTA